MKETLCALCGKHEVMTEYFEDKMHHYCLTHDTYFDPDEIEAWFQQREQEDLAFGIDKK